jgi:hypothetical protein
MRLQAFPNFGFIQAHGSHKRSSGYSVLGAVLQTTVSDHFFYRTCLRNGSDSDISKAN